MRETKKTYLSMDSNPVKYSSPVTQKWRRNTARWLVSENSIDIISGISKVGNRWKAPWQKPPGEKLN